MRSQPYPRALTYLMAVMLLALLTPNTSPAAVMHGMLVYGHEARTFQPCGETRTLWVNASGWLHRQLQTEYQNLIKTPYQSVYVEIVGEILDQAVGEFAKDYEAVIEVRELRVISPEGIGACRTKRHTATLGAPIASSTRTYVLVCDNQSTYTIRATATEAWIFRREGTLRLPAVPTEAGAKYANEVFEIWILGEHAQLGKPTGKLQSCLNDRRRAVWEHAKLNGADFRAVGNEPGWYLVIMAASRIVLVSNYGESRIEVPLPQPIVDREARTTRWETDQLVLEVTGQACRDSMSGEEFESTVVVTTQTEILRGCGRALH